MGNKKKKVIQLQNIQDIDSSLVTPESLIPIISDEIEESNIEKAFVILVDKEGYKYYTAKMEDEEIILAFEAIKMLLLATRFIQ